MTGIGALGALLDSRSIAVVGASSRPGSSGERVVHHLAAAGYQGEVVLISRREPEIAGRRTYPSLTAYPGSIDHALLLVPAGALEATIGDCVEQRVGAASIFAAGFAEVGTEGEWQQARLCELAAGGGVRLLGPNCLGVMNARIGLMATASSALESLDVRSGPVSIVTQSGAIGMHFVALLTQAGLGLGYYVSTGNEADVTAAEVFDHIVSDEGTEVVLTYLEGVRDPDRFCGSLQRLADAGKTVIAIKVGRTPRSSAAVASHTAALAGDDEVYDAVLKRLGVLRVDSLAAAVDAAGLVVSGAARRPRPDHVAVVSISGGMGVLMAEMLEARHYDMPVPSAAAQSAMREIVPFCTPGNPIDVTGQITGEPDILAQFLELVVRDEQSDAIAVLLSYTVLVPRVFEIYREALLRCAAESGLLVAVDGIFDDSQLRELASRAIVAGRDSHDLIRRLDLVRALQDARDHRRAYQPTAPGMAPETILPEVTAMTWMADAGVPMADWLQVRAVAEAASVVEKLGGSAALKVLVPDVLHKAQAGLVMTGVRPAEAAAAAARMMDGQSPEAVLVAQAMAPTGGAEVILGARRDEVFGLVFLVGHGGLGAEAAADTAVLLPPAEQAEFSAALSGLRTPVRTRSGSAIDEKALWQAFQSLARLATSNPSITEAELNPVIVGPPGTGAVAVDAVIRCRGSASIRSQPRSGGRMSITSASTAGEVRAYVADWLESHLPGEWVRAVKDNDAETLQKVRDLVPVDEWFDSLEAAGLVAPDWPTEYGGLGLTGDQRRVVSTELSRYKTPRFFNPIGINLVGPALLRWGTEEQKAAHLRPIAAHREIWCQLFSEPGAGSDLAGLATMATRDGDSWRINGSKIWSSFAHRADWGLLLTRSAPDQPKHQGITVFLLNMRTPGITIRPLRHITGDHEFNQTFFDNVFVPDSARLGPANEGWTVTQTVLMNERTSGSGQGAALPGTVSGRSVSGIIARHTPVSDPELRRRLAQMWIEDQLIQLTNKRIITRRRAGQPTGPEGSIMKLYASEHTQRMHDLAIDLEGLNGVAWPEDDRWLKNTAWSFLRVRSKTIAGGTSEIQRNILGERVLGLPREPGLPSSTPWKDIPRS